MVPNRVTLRDIARQAGCSISTVSRALNDMGRISPKTRLRVRDIAKKLGYKPDPVLGRLASYRQKTIKAKAGSTLALITDSKGEVHPAGKMRIKGAIERAEQLGYSLEVFFLRDFEWRVRRMANVLHSRGIEGIIIDAVRARGSYDGFPWRKFFAISMGEGAETLPISTVSSDIFIAINMTWSEAKKAGYSRPGLILRKETTETFRRSCACAKLLESLEPEGSNPVPALPLTILPGPGELPVLREWVEKHQPDVVLGHVSALKALKSLGFKIPRDLAFASFALNAEEIDEHWIAGARMDLLRSGSLAAELCHLAFVTPYTRHPETQISHLVKPHWHSAGSMPRHRNGLKG